ncbi:MAG TPA: gluconate 2-dehydrogenase subunit 3 family protein [Microlunatus sp.]
MTPLRKRAEGLTPGGQQDRFAGFDVLGQSPHWDPVTTGVVLSRLSLPGPLRFFDLAEEAVARPLLDALLDQRDGPRVPVLEMIDLRLAGGEGDGWRYAELPEDGEAWKKSLRALDDDARSASGSGFAACSRDGQLKIIQSVQDLGRQDWHRLRADRIWSLWTRYACTAFYSHPWAWNEIGFGGPAYPRGYKNARVDGREPFEVADAGPSQIDHDRGGGWR